MGIYADQFYPAILFLFFHVGINKRNRVEAESVSMKFSKEGIVCNTVKYLSPSKLFQQNFFIEWCVPIFNEAYQNMIYIPFFLVSKNKIW